MIIYENYVYKALQNTWAYGRNLVAFCHFHKRFVTKKQLKLMQGFPKDYIIDRDIEGKPYPLKEQVARIGNSVVPVMAKAIVEANCGAIKKGERVPNFSTEQDENGQIKLVV